MSQSPAPSSSFGPTKSLVRVGGALGIAASSITLLIFTVGCFGFQAVFVGLPIIPLLLSVPGMLLVIIGATLKKTAGDEDTHVLGAMFLNLIGFLSALLEISLWMKWDLFYHAPVAG